MQKNAHIQSIFYTSNEFIGSWPNVSQIQILRSNWLPRRLEAAVSTVPPRICRFFFGWELVSLLNDQLSLITKNNRDIGISLNFIPKFSWFWKEFWTLFYKQKAAIFPIPSHFISMSFTSLFGRPTPHRIPPKRRPHQIQPICRNQPYGFLAGSSSPVGSTYPEGIPLNSPTFVLKVTKKLPTPDTHWHTVTQKIAHMRWTTILHRQIARMKRQKPGCYLARIKEHRKG